MQALRFLATHPLSSRLLFNGHAARRAEGRRGPVCYERLSSPRTPGTTLGDLERRTESGGSTV